MTLSPRDHYIRTNFVPMDDALARVGEHLSPKERIMQISPQEGKLLQMLLQMIGAHKVVEIGVLAGFSAIWMARALPEDGHLYAIEKNYKRIQPSLDNFHACGVAEKITLREGAAGDILPALSSHAPFDAVFIDADKGNYPTYLDWAEQHVRSGGLIIGDNSLLFGAVYGEQDSGRNIAPQSIQAMQEFNRRLADPEHYVSMLLPTDEGLTVALKR